MKLTERQTDALCKIEAGNQHDDTGMGAYCECAPKREKPFDHRSLEALRRKGLIDVWAGVIHLCSNDPLDSGGVYYCKPTKAGLKLAWELGSGARTVDPRPGTFAHTARLMAQDERHLPAGDRTDWDDWKEDMKEGGRT